MDGYSVASSYQRHLTPQHYSIEENSNDTYEEDTLLIDLTPNVDNAITLNLTYATLLTETLDEIYTLLNLNFDRQTELQEEIDQLMENKSKRLKGRVKRLRLGDFGIPYFKDGFKDFTTPPKNEDTKFAESLGFRNIALISPWSRCNI